MCLNIKFRFLNFIGFLGEDLLLISINQMANASDSLNLGQLDLTSEDYLLDEIEGKFLF